MDEWRDGERQYDIVARRPGSGPEAALLLNSHLDTVPPGDPVLWTACGGRPFELTSRDGLLYGLGAADVKLDFVCKLLALERLQEAPLTREVVLAGTYGEETGRWGAKLLAKTLRPQPTMALVGEPTGARPCLAHKGYMEIHLKASAPPAPAGGRRCWRLSFEGVAAHSSQPGKGRSANDDCLDALTRLAAEPGFRLLALDGGDLVNRVATRAVAVVSLEGRPDPALTGPAAVEPAEAPASPAPAAALVALLLEAHASTRLLRDRLQADVAEGFDPPWSTLNNGLLRLEEGSLIHVIDVRRLPGSGPLEAIEDHIGRLHQAMAGSDCDASVETELDSPPFAALPESQVAAALSAALTARGLPVAPELKSGTTEASVYAAAGIDTVVFGPGQAGGNIHRPNECVPVSELEAAVQIYADVILRLCTA